MAVQRRTSHRVESFKLPAGALEEALVPIEHTQDRCEHDEGVWCGKANDEECAKELDKPTEEGGRHGGEGSVDVALVFSETVDDSTHRRRNEEGLAFKRAGGAGGGGGACVVRNGDKRRGQLCPSFSFSLSFYVCLFLFLRTIGARNRLESIPSCSTFPAFNPSQASASWLTS